MDFGTQTQPSLGWRRIAAFGVDYGFIFAYLGFLTLAGVLGRVAGVLPTDIATPTGRVVARQIGAPALIATGLLAVGVAVAEADPEQARARLRESRELSTWLGYHSPIDLLWATAIACMVGDQIATLELGRRAIHGFQWSGDRVRAGSVLHMIAITLATTRPEAAAIIQGAAEA